MALQSNFLIPSRQSEFEEKLGLTRVAGMEIDYRVVDGGFFSLDFGHKNVKDEDCYLTVDGRRLSFEDAGLSNVEISDKSGCSAYHIPQGSMIIYDPTDRRTAKWIFSNHPLNRHVPRSPFDNFWKDPRCQRPQAC